MSRTEYAKSPRGWIEHGVLIRLGALIAIGVIFGGGGRGGGLPNLVVQLTAILILMLSRVEIVRFFSQAPLALRGLVLASLALPVLQIIPLPPQLWQSLPGRSLVMESLALLGAADSWMPASLDPALTLLAAIGLIAPFTVLILAWSLPSNSRSLTILVLFGIALISWLIGTVQLATGGSELSFYQTNGARRLTGLFANPNSSGIFFVLMLCFLVQLKIDWPWRALARWGGLVLGFIFLVGVVLSQSRSSIALAALPMLVFFFSIIRSDTVRQAGWRVHFLALPLFIALAAGSVYLLSTNAKFDQTVERFDSFENKRPKVWADTRVNAHRFWPAGSGVGTFDEVFQLDEALESTSPRRPGRAHNDYLEVAVESGIVGLLLVAAWFVLTALAALRILKARNDPFALGGLTGFLCLALQSLVDYPLRSQALLCLAALMLVFILKPQAKSRKDEV